MKRLAILILVLGLYLLAACGGGDSAETEKVLVINSWGGWFQDQQRVAMFEPFAQNSGIEVRELSDGENQFAKAKAQIEAGQPEMDIIHGDASWLVRGQQEGIWAPIDYAQVSKTNLYSDILEEYGVGILYWSFNIVYNTNTFPDTHPDTWAEVWDYAQANPGRVTLWGARPNYVIEAALMAAGYEMSAIYPLDEQKLTDAFASLDKIKDVVVWFDTGSQGQKLFSDEEVVLGMFYGGDTFGLVDQGVPLQVEWNQGVYTRDYWLVLKDAPHYANAMSFINYVSQQADVQANFARATGYGPINQTAFDLITDEQALSRLPSWSPNKDKQLSYDSIWWGEHDDELGERWNNWLRQ